MTSHMHVRMHACLHTFENLCKHTLFAICLVVVAERSEGHSRDIVLAYPSWLSVFQFAKNGIHIFQLVGAITKRAVREMLALLDLIIEHIDTDPLSDVGFF